MMNTCETCNWKFSILIDKDVDNFPVIQNKCWPGGDSDSEQEAGIPCLKWARIEEGKDD